MAGVLPKRRIDAVPLPVLVDVLEELGSRQVPTVLHHPRELAIAHLADVADAVLGAKVELDATARDPHMAVAQRGQTERVVL